MKRTRMLVLSVCLASMLLGCAEAQLVTTPCHSCTNATVNGSDTSATTTAPTHVTSSNLPATSNSSTATNTTSRKPTRAPGAAAPAPAGGAETSPVASAASLLELCAHLLVPAISVLICGALG